MKRLIYISSARTDLVAQDFEDILLRSIEHNTTAGVSGLLLYNGMNFLQVLEGDPAGVDSTFARIEKDPRHGGVVEVMADTPPRRIFPEWGMHLKFMRRQAQHLPSGAELTNDVFDSFPKELPDELMTILQRFSALKG